ncbi:MAG: efflux RND transporter periplasmic adaptor subunit, partial [Candidatus Caenarcaniphilales bacterium]|nr:efflux RND transporter periplasmic adaptor subunit [Candidatus Caenarcaniphilales bacterium]
LIIIMSNNKNPKRVPNVQIVNQEKSNAFIEIQQTEKDSQQKSLESLAEINRQSKQSTTSIEKTNKSGDKKTAIFCLILLVVLLIPFPQSVGGEIEIEGSSDTQQAILRPAVSGIVEKVLVKTNQDVKAGEPLIVLRNWELEEKKIEAEKQLARIKASVGSLNAQAEVARAEYRRAQEDYKRQKFESDYVVKNAQALQSDNLPPRIDSTKKHLEQLKLESESLKQKAKLHKYLAKKGVYPQQGALQSIYEAKSSEKQVQALSSQLQAETDELQERSNQSKPKANEVYLAADANLKRYSSARQEVNVAISQIKGLEEQIALYNTQVERLTLKSPIDGKVLTLKTNMLLGQNFNRGDVVAIVGDLSEAQIKLQLPEEAIAYVKPGQKVTVRVKGVPDRAFAGEVKLIAPVTSETGEQMSKKRIFEISILMKNAAGLLKPGMTGYATIHTDTKKSLLTLAWDEVYRVFRLDRFMDRNPINSLL